MASEVFTKMIPNAVINLGNVEKINQIIHKFPDHLFIIFFTSPWCNACKSFQPIFEKMQERYYHKGVIFAKADVNDMPEVTQQFQIMGTPTTIFIKKQKVKKKQVGMVTISKFIALMNELL